MLFAFFHNFAFHMHLQYLQLSVFSLMQNINAIHSELQRKLKMINENYGVRIKPTYNIWKSDTVNPNVWVGVKFCFKQRSLVWIKFCKRYFLSLRVRRLLSLSKCSLGWSNCSMILKTEKLVEYSWGWLTRFKMLKACTKKLCWSWR